MSKGPRGTEGEGEGSRSVTAFQLSDSEVPEVVSGGVGVGVGVGVLNWKSA